MVIIKIVTICGSLKLQKGMMAIAQKLAIEGNCVLTPVYPVLKDINLTNKQVSYLKEQHFKKIELSDEIFVTNINNYIGKSASLEIDYAKKLGKKIKYYSDLSK